jgi:hypothetical protein
MSQEKIKSEGTCYFCGKTFTKTGINRHLKTHLEDKTSGKKNETSFLLKIEADPEYGASPYFLSLWVDGETTLDMIDGYLRSIWLECCGHMSAFRNPAARRRGYGYLPDFLGMDSLLESGTISLHNDWMEDSSGKIPMNRKSKKVFYPDFKLKYEYDFGSTTILLITTVAQYPFKPDTPIVLLSRNEPPKLLCQTCKKEPATQTCTGHGWEEDSLFCPKCAKKHAKTCPEFDEYAAMPVVNSPRMGVCGYEGGTIDRERDGVYKG